MSQPRPPEIQTIAADAAVGEAAGASTQAARPKSSTAAATQQRADDSRLRRVLRLPVTASVRLAERKMELGQLLSLAPGALITFSKPHDQPLELYVNNHLYCRGEAVKAGEKYAIRLSEILRAGPQA